MEICDGSLLNIKVNLRMDLEIIYTHVSKVPLSAIN